MHLFLQNNLVKFPDDPLILMRFMVLTVTSPHSFFRKIRGAACIIGLTLIVCQIRSIFSSKDVKVVKLYLIATYCYVSFAILFCYLSSSNFCNLLRCFRSLFQLFLLHS